jgi:hypothetical protein
VAPGGRELKPSHIKPLYQQIPFFCGSSPQCWEPGSEWALTRAKAVLAEHYLLVGQTEDLAGMYQVLELVSNMLPASLDLLPFLLLSAPVAANVLQGDGRVPGVLGERAHKEHAAQGGCAPGHSYQDAQNQNLET